MVKISVVIPIYNTALYLEECLNSIINQTLMDIEIICVNDGSTDNSQNILEHYAQEESRIKIIIQENQGQSVARNQGLKIAQGEYIYFMDSDDILDINALDYLYKEAEKEQIDVLYFDATTFFENQDLKIKYAGYYTNYSYERTEELDGIYTGYEMMMEFHRIKGYRVSPCLQLISRAFMLREDITFYEGIIHEDQLFNFITMLSANRVSHRKEEFFKRRVRENSTMTQEISAEHIRGYITSYMEMNIFIENKSITQQDMSGVNITIGKIRKSIVAKLQSELILDADISENMFTWQEWEVIRRILLDEVINLNKLTLTQKEEKKRIIEEKKEVIEAKNQVIQAKNRAIEEKKEIIEKKKEIIEEKKEVIEEKKRVIEAKNRVIEEKKQVIEEKKQVIEEKKLLVKESKDIIKDKEKMIEGINQELNRKNSEVVKLNNQLIKATEQRTNLETEIKNIYESITYKSGSVLTYIPRKIKTKVKSSGNHK